MTKERLAALRVILKTIRQQISKIYPGNSEFLIPTKDGTRVDLFALSDDDPLPEPLHEWLYPSNPDSQQVAVDVLTQMESLLASISSSTSATQQEIPDTTSPSTSKSPTETRTSVQPKALPNTSPTDLPLVTLNPPQKMNTPPHSAAVKTPVLNQQSKDSDLNSSDSSLLQSNTDKSIYRGTQIAALRPQLNDAWAQMGIPYDKCLLIRNIRLFTTCVTIEFENGMYKEIKYDLLPTVFQYAAAAPALTFSSCFKTRDMKVNILDLSIRHMRSQFWEFCKHVTIEGEFWLGPVITRIVDVIPTTVTSFMMRQFTVVKDYRLKWSLGRNMVHLQHLNYDCRVTDNKDLVNNVSYLKFFNKRPTLNSLFLNVVGFPGAPYLLRQVEDNIQKALTKDGTATILTEQHVDDYCCEMLQTANYSYCGSASSRSAFHPYQSNNYDLFNTTFNNGVMITFGFLQRPKWQ